jgi:hypothetical protein
MGEFEDNGGTVESIFSVPEIRGEDGKSGTPEEVRRSVSCREATKLGEEVEARGGVGFEVSGVVWGVVLAGVSMAPRVAVAGSGEVAGMRWSSTIVG